MTATIIPVRSPVSPPPITGDDVEEPVNKQSRLQKVIGAWPFWIMVVAFAEVAEVIVLVLT